MTHREEQIGDCRLILGDALEVLPTLGKVDAVVTDPPYGVEFRGEAWDAEIPEIATKLPIMFDRVAIIMGIPTVYKFPEPKWTACWARPASSSRSRVGGFSHWSPILLYGNVKMSVDFRSWHAIANAYEPGFGHPSPKPLCVMEWLVREITVDGETILDPFMGSGTTLVACAKLGRRGIGIEIEPKYYEIALRRVEQAYKQADLFIPAPAKAEQPPLPLADQEAAARKAGG